MESESKLLQGLNAAQREAVEFKDGPLLVLAGPGSGKTRVVTHRIARLLETGVFDRNIAALTFTNKAAEEMKSRLERLSPGNRVWIGTFHRFCSWILRNYIDYTGLQPNFTIYDTDESKQLIDGLIDKKELPNGVDAGKILAAISWAKNGLVLPDDYQAREGHLLGKTVEKIYPEYQKALRRANAVDFDDLLVHVALLLKHNPEIRQQLDYRFRYILVDEYQDTNLVQYAIARALSIDYPNLAVTGDPDQSIYGWRGANIKNILEFEKDFENQSVKVIRLEQNYRSCGNILAAAAALIKHNKYRKEKDLYTENPEGKKPRILRCFNHQEEAETIAREIADEIEAGLHSPKDYAIFFRMNALSRNLEHALRRFRVPFQLVRGLEFFNRKEIKDILAYLQLIYNPNDTVSFLRVINLPVRGIGKVTVSRLRDFAEYRGISIFEAAKNVQVIPGIAAKTVKSVRNFVAMIEKLSEMSADSELEVLLSCLLEATKYLLPLQDAESEDEKQRLANVQELLSEAREFDRQYNERQKQEELDPTTLLENPYSDPGRLGQFLEQAALVSDVDAYDDSDRVSLMTLHAAKGLEFPIVYIIALEDGILPHERSANDKMQLEEERRLFFVGMTRAQEELRISRTEFREYRGNYSTSILSRFLFELPSDKIEIADARTLAAPSESQEIPETDENQEWQGSETESQESNANESQNGESETFLSDYLNETDGEEDFDNEDFIREDSDGERAIASGRFREAEDEEISSPSRHKKGKQKSSANREIIDEGSEIYREADEYCDLPPEQGGELRFDDDGNLIPSMPAKRSAPKTPKRPLTSLRVAADLGSGSSTKTTAPLPPQETPIKIQKGTLVRHPNYGVGIVASIFGPPSDRIGTIEFLSGVGTIEIPLSDPLLKPIQGKKKD